MDAVDPTVELALTGGPDAGRALPLSAGRMLLGRAAAAASIDDPSVEAHHAILVVGPGGDVELAQLAGRSAVRVDGAPLHGRRRLTPGSVVELGSTRAELRSIAPELDDRAAWSSRVLIRSPQHPAAGHRATARRRSGDRAPSIDRHVVDIARAADAEVARRRRVVEGGRGRSRRATDPDAFLVSLGVTTDHVPVELVDPEGSTVDPATLDLTDQAVLDRATRRALPVVVDLARHEVVAVRGTGGWRVARSLLVQLAVRLDPSAWIPLPIVHRCADEAWLAHLRRATASVSARPGPLDTGDPDALARFVDRLLRGRDGRRVVGVCGADAVHGSCGGSIRRLVSAGHPATLVVLVDPSAPVPSVCGAALDIGTTWRGTWTGDRRAASSTCRLHVAGCSSTTALERCRTLAEPSSSPTGQASPAGAIGRSSLRR